MQSVLLLADVDVDATCSGIVSLAVHEAWFAANSLSFRFGDAKVDREKADSAIKKLQQILPFELANVLRRLAKHSAWYAANMRRLFMQEAWRNEKVWKECQALLRSKMPEALAEAIELLCVHAGWHAANVRSFLWSAAAYDFKRYNETLVEMKCQMRTVQMEEQSMRMSGSLSVYQADGNEQPLGSGRQQDCCSLACGAVPKLLSDWRAKRRGIEVSAPFSPDGNQGEVLDMDDEPSQVVAPPSLQRSNNLLNETVDRWKVVGCSKDGVTAAAFLLAASATATIFDCLGSVVSKVKADIQGNIDKIQQNVDKAGGDSSQLLLEKMVKSEVAAAGSAAKAMKEGSTTTALLWLGRMLRLVERFLGALAQDSKASLSDCVKVGYNACLSPHHPWMVRTAMGVAFSGCPTRETFYKNLGDNPAEVASCVRPLFAAMGPSLHQLQKFMIEECQGLEQRDA